MRAVAVCLLLCACAASPEYERQVALYGPWCERLGLLSGTEGYGNCVMEQSMIDEQRQKARSRP
jgi:hypothetical protein